jgi:hypothetical protein
MVTKHNSWRFTVNYVASGVNESIEKDNYQLPIVMPKLQKLSKYKGVKGFHSLFTPRKKRRISGFLNGLAI